MFLPIHYLITDPVTLPKTPIPAGRGEPSWATQVSFVKLSLYSNSVAISYSEDSLLTMAVYFLQLETLMSK